MVVLDRHQELHHESFMSLPIFLMTNIYLANLYMVLPYSSQCVLLLVVDHVSLYVIETKYWLFFGIIKFEKYSWSVTWSFPKDPWGCPQTRLSITSCWTTSPSVVLESKPGNKGPEWISWYVGDEAEYEDFPAVKVLVWKKLGTGQDWIRATFFMA